MSRLLFALLLCLPVLPWVTQAAHADSRFEQQHRQYRIERSQQQRAERSLSEAIAIARARVPGELISAKKSGNLYQVRILSRKGVVRTVRVPVNAN